MLRLTVAAPLMHFLAGEKPVTRWRRRFAGPVLIVLGCGLANVSCRGDEIATSTLAEPTVSVRDVEPVGTRFAADVEVTGPSFTLPGKGEAPVRRLKYHVEKVKRADGRWRTVYSALRSSMSGSPGGGRDVAGPLSRIEVDDSAGVTLYDKRGVRVDAQRLKAPDLPRGQSQGLSEAPAVKQVMALLGRSAERGLKAGQFGGLPSDRPGLSAFMVGDGQRQALAMDLKAHGRLRGREGSRQHYMVSLGQGVLELEIDSVIGAPTQIGIRPPRGPATQVTYGYTRASDGRYVRTFMRSERTAYGSAPATVYEMRLSNVEFSRGEGQ